MPYNVINSLLIYNQCIYFNSKYIASMLNQIIGLVLNTYLNNRIKSFRINVAQNRMFD